MNRISFIWLFAFYVIFCPICSESSVFDNEISEKVLNVNNGFAEMSKDLIPAVVSIATEHKVVTAKQPSRSSRIPFFPFLEEFREFFEGIDPYEGEKLYQENRAIASLGSGFFIDKKGIIVTNYHVIKNAKRIKVTLEDGTQANAKVLGTDIRTDLAVLKIDIDRDVPFVVFGDSNNIRVGDWVVAIGNPFGIGVSVSAGVVSARFRDINSSELGLVSDFIQTDAAINKGNSGGPLFSTDGKVMGINTAIFSPSGDNVGIGFAIPSNNAKSIVNILMSGKKVEHGWLGVIVQQMTNDMYESLNLKDNYGVLVSSVVNDSPADKAGIREGDVILSVNGEKIKKSQKLLQVILNSSPGDSIKLSMYKNGKVSNIKLALGKLDDENKEENFSEDEQVSSYSYDNIGFDVRELTSELKKGDYSKHNLKNGIVVSSVNRDSDAFDKGIREKDVVLQLNQHEVKNVKQFTDLIRKEKSEGKKYVLLLIKKLNNPTVPMFFGVKLR